MTTTTALTEESPIDVYPFLQTDTRVFSCANGPDSTTSKGEKPLCKVYDQQLHLMRCTFSFSFSLRLFRDAQVDTNEWRERERRYVVLRLTPLSRLFRYPLAA